MVKELEPEDRETLLILLKTEKDRIIESIKTTEDPDRIEDREDELDLTNKCINYISNRKQLTDELIKHIRNVLFFDMSKLIHEDGEDLDNYWSIANSLEIKDELKDLLKVYDKKVHSN